MVNYKFNIGFMSSSKGLPGLLKQEIFALKFIIDVSSQK